MAKSSKEKKRGKRIQGEVLKREKEIKENKCCISLRRDKG